MPKGKNKMGTSKEQIRVWLKRGVEQGASHVCVVCDTFDYEDYPVFVAPTESIESRVSGFHNDKWNRLMEVYDLSLDIESQLREDRAMHYKKQNVDDMLIKG
jgi:hypothetical protein